MTRPVLLLALAAAAQLALPDQPAAALAPEPAEVTQQLGQLLAGRPHLFLSRLGTSVEGRAIPLVIATSRPARIESQLRVVVLARQHGDEPVPARSALLWLGQQGATSAAFERVAVLLVPTVNPDGAARGTRGNAVGVDLNRDWVAQSQPETQAVVDLLHRWRPHALVDLHTFDGVIHDDGTRGDEDWVEHHETGDARLDQLNQDLISEVVTAQTAVGERELLVPTSHGAAVTLAHRYAARRWGMLAWLFEVGDSRVDPEARLLGLLVDSLARKADWLKPQLDAQMGLSDWRSPEQLAAPRPIATPAAPPPPPPARPVVPLVWVAATYGLVLMARAKFGATTAD